MRFLRVLSAGILLLALPAACGTPEEESTGQVERAVVPAGSPPVNTIPGSQGINEDTPLVFGQATTQFAFSDADSAVVTTHFVTTHGSMSMRTIPTDLIVTGNGTANLTITGAPGRIAAALNGINPNTMASPDVNTSALFTPAEDFVGDALITVNTNDSDSNTDVDSFIVTMAAVNDPPVNIVPNGNQAGTEDVPRTFSSISVQDVDVVGPSSMIVTLVASNGSKITLADTAGLTFSQGDGTDDGTMRFTGLLIDINSALNGMTVTPALNFIGTSQLTITSNDQQSFGSGEIGIDTDVIAIDWAAVNDPPVNTLPATVSTAEEAPFTFSNTNRISVNDVDATVSLLQVTLSVTGGTLTLGSPSGVMFTTGDGTADTTMVFAGTLANLNNALNNTVFTPAVDFVGAATLSVTTNDQGNTGAGGPQQDSDQVTINVAAVNDAPVNTVPASQTIPEDAFLALSGNNNNLISVADVDAPSLQVTLSVTNGVLTLAGGNGLSFTTGDGTTDATMTFQGTTAAINSALNGLRYDPNPNFNGTATISIVTSDLGATGSGGTKTASSSVTVTVSAVNDPPNAVADAFTVSEDSVAANHNLVANDTTVDIGEALTISAVTNAAHGTAAIVNATSVSYVPDPDYSGPDSFTYTISDPGGLTSSATVTVTVIGVNDPPTAAADSFTFAANSNGNVANVLANDSSAPDSGETLTITAVTAPQHGSATFTGGQQILYTPTPGFNSGTDSFSYTISDGNSGTASASVTITITPQNATPLAQADEMVVNEDAVGTLDLALNDQHGNDPVKVVIAQGPAHGSAVVPMGSTIATYTPEPNFNGTDTFTYTLEDNDHETSTATVTVTVRPQDDVPQAVSDPNNVTDEDTAIVIPVLANDSGLFDLPITVAITAQPAAGTGTATAGANNTVTFTPAPNFNGLASFQYSVTDADGAAQASQASVIVTVRPVNDPPKAKNDTLATNINMAIDAAPLLANDTDPDAADELTITDVGTPIMGGTVTISADGKSVRFVPKMDFMGSDTFAYTISDAAGLTSNATVVVSVGLDTDEDGLLDTEEIAAGTDINNPDTDGDGLKDGIEVKVTKTSPLDADSDDDGLLDPSEDKNEDGVLDGNETDPNKKDTDGDGLQDGTELGLDAPETTESDPEGLHSGTDPDVFIPDVDPTTTTNPRNADTDGGSVKDGDEDLNHNGRVDLHETDPNNPNDDPKPPDGDFDGVPDATDNCPMTWNQDQADTDGNGIGDECELSTGGGGCGCRVGGEGAGGSGLPAGAALVVLGVAFALRARRRRR